MNFLNQNRILYNWQFGFRPRFSTSDAVNTLVEYLYDSLNQKLFSINVFIDFSRAFDTIDRSILFRKLEAYGIRGTPLRLIVDYFSNRRQYVTVNNFSSPVKSVNLGIGQGTVLGPLFFSSFILMICPIYPISLEPYFMQTIPH